MSDGSTRREDVDGIITVTFTRPEKRNAINNPMFEVLEEAIRDLREIDENRVLVIAAEGEYFTGGQDISTLNPTVGYATDGVRRTSNMRWQYRGNAHHDLWDQFEQVEKPVIQAIQGHCLGAGVEMGVSCDFRFASENATFGLPEVPNLASIPGSGGISRLTKLVGPHWARWLAMAGERIDAQQAMSMGYLHAVYPADELQDKVQAFARKLAGMPREAVGVAKFTIDSAADLDRHTSRFVDRLAQTLLFSSQEFSDRVNAFNDASAAREKARKEESS